MVEGYYIRVKNGVAEGRPVPRRSVATSFSPSDKVRGLTSNSLMISMHRFGIYKDFWCGVKFKINQ